MNTSCSHTERFQLVIRDYGAHLWLTQAMWAALCKDLTESVMEITFNSGCNLVNHLNHVRTSEVAIIKK